MLHGKKKPVAAKNRGRKIKKGAILCRRIVCWGKKYIARWTWILGAEDLLKVFFFLTR